MAEGYRRATNKEGLAGTAERVARGSGLRASRMAGRVRCERVSSDGERTG